MRPRPASRGHASEIGTLFIIAMPRGIAGVFCAGARHKLRATRIFGSLSPLFRHPFFSPASSLTRFNVIQRVNLLNPRLKAARRACA